MARQEKFDSRDAFVYLTIVFDCFLSELFFNLGAAWIRTIL